MEINMKRPIQVENIWIQIQRKKIKRILEIDSVSTRSDSPSMMLDPNEFAIRTYHLQIRRNFSNNSEDGNQSPPPNMKMPVALMNLGNTCYLNAIIQSLKVIPELQQELKSYKHANGTAAGSIAADLFSVRKSEKQ